MAGKHGFGPGNSAGMVGWVLVGLACAVFLTWATGSSKGRQSEPFETPGLWVPVLVGLVLSAVAAFVVEQVQKRRDR